MKGLKNMKARPLGFLPWRNWKKWRLVLWVFLVLVLWDLNHEGLEEHEGSSSGFSTMEELEKMEARPLGFFGARPEDEELKKPSRTSW